MRGIQLEARGDLAVGQVVTDHADRRPISSPSFASNRELAAARTDAVAGYLAEQGVPDDMLFVSAEGATDPVAAGQPVALQMNRRVELRVLPDYGSVGDIPEELIVK